MASKQPERSKSERGGEVGPRRSGQEETARARHDPPAANAANGWPKESQRAGSGRGPARSNAVRPRESRAVGYLRRSTDRQEQSIPDQQKAIAAYCAEHGLTLLRSYTDDAISGTSALGRKAFQQMLEDAQGRACDFGVIVCYDVKRFGRVDNDEAGYYRHLLKTNGVEVAYASENFTGDYTDDLLRPVKQWQARQESKDLSKVTIRGLLSKCQGGSWMGGVAPHGCDLKYENERGGFLFIVRHMPDGTKQVLNERGRVVRRLARGEALNISKRDRAVLILGDPVRVETVRTMFHLYVKEGRGLKAIADALNRAGTPTPRGPAWSHIYAGKWQTSTVRAILVNPLYAGDMVWNRRTDARFHMIVEGRAVERKHAHGARLVPNDKADWIVIRDTHEALVDRKLFLKAQELMAGRGNGAAKENGGRPVGGWSGSRSQFILSGLVRCAKCGGRYQGVTRTKGRPKKDGTKIKTRSYACGSYIRLGTSACSYNPIGQETLENAVIDVVLKHYSEYKGPEGPKKITAEVRASTGVEAEDLADARKRLDADRRTIEAKIANLLDNVSTRSRDLVEERLTTLRRERTQLDTRREELELLASRQSAVQDQVQEIARFVDGLEFTLRHGVNVEKAASLRRCVGKVEVKQGGEVAVELAPLLAKGRDGQSVVRVAMRQIGARAGER